MHQEDLYIKYFEHQAINHPSLLHQTGAKNRVFEVVGIDEALGDMRTQGAEKGFLMRLIRYTFRVSDAEGGGQVVKVPTGGFLILKYNSDRQQGSQSRLDASAAAEKVMGDMIEKIIADSLNGHPLWCHSLDSHQNFSVQAYEGVADYVGWRCIFSWNQEFINCPGDVNMNWGDGGLTPLDLFAEPSTLLGDSQGRVLVDGNNQAIGVD